MVLFEEAAVGIVERNKLKGLCTGHAGVGQLLLLPRAEAFFTTLRQRRRCFRPQFLLGSLRRSQYIPQ